MGQPSRPGREQRPLVSEGIADDVLANSITILEALKDAASAVGAVPFLGGIIAAALGIAKAVEQSRANTDAFVSVAERAVALAEYVQKKTLGSNGGTIGVDMQVILLELHSALVKVQDAVKRELEKGRFNRFFRRAKLHGKAQECLLKLDDAWRSFDTAILVRLERQVESLRSQVESQAPFEPGTLVPYVPFTSIQKDRTTTQYKTRTHNGEQRSGIWDNRPVTVRIFDHKFKDNVFESIQMYSENHRESHETFSNVIAMAYPRAGVQFYVLDGLRRSILTDFDSKDPVIWVEKLFQHLVDAAAHRDHRQHFLPEAPVWHNSAITFDALVRVRDHVSRSNFSRLWHSIISGVPCHILEITGNDAKPGDYGYIPNHPDGPRFTYLGNIDDVFESSVDIVYRECRVYHDTRRTPFKHSTWSDNTVESEEFTIVPSQNDPGRWCIGKGIGSGISGDTYDKFFTDHALRLSRLHGIDLSDLFLVSSRYYEAWACTGEDHTHGTHTTAWLHKQPLDEHGVPHEPWAYWSFDEEPVPVGHPPPDVPQGPGCFRVIPPRLWARGLGPFIARMNVMLAEASKRDRCAGTHRKAMDTDKIAPRTGHSCAGESSDDDGDVGYHTASE
ncbi:uncharacterized protein BXZ73DRAFT_105859 [Epithele typhae]|uniref:uncharacterized protein n=1 Tax=Epithele typhae TaxID=378194 RepID=UPI0020083C41|nr:uncharacterized protein BXZ73DRAFT_105859 [Epithele typhae]KAH9916422.1 hypothetical protein BXZ73DRAFT_105859 [Epithele typhae]